MNVLVTGSGGLVGSECVRTLSALGWDVTGVDNNSRQWLFGPCASTEAVVREFVENLPRYRHYAVDIRDRQGIRDLLRNVRPNFIIHTAAQPSHDKAAAIPYDDFDINAGGTLNLLTAARDFAPEAPFCFTSSNKVYGDRPNYLPLVETATRWEYADGLEGISETFPVDQSLHSLFGASKLAADILCQEYGRYFGMPVGIFRAGCLTGAQHAAVELHGYLNYIVRCAVSGTPYTIRGYNGKQVRDQLHCEDVVSIFLEFYGNPRCGEVYNLGGGRENTVSIRETVDMLSACGLSLHHAYDDQARIGDHICYISDLRKVREDYPNWRIQRSVPYMVEEIIKYHKDGRTTARQRGAS
jgi:CDP-paratose 2-epimerase